MFHRPHEVAEHCGQKEQHVQGTEARLGGRPLQQQQDRRGGAGSGEAGVVGRGLCEADRILGRVLLAGAGQQRPECRRMVTWEVETRAGSPVGRR